MELRDDKEIHTVVEFSKKTSEGNPNEISNNEGHEVPTLQLLPLNEAHSRQFIQLNCLPRRFHRNTQIA